MNIENTRKIHLIGNAHIDPVWLWRWQDGFSEIKATFQSALDRMNEFDDFIFTCAGASYYKWIEENSPVMFEEIKKRISEGRWKIVGGWWLQPDCNAPCGESFVRHSLYSQGYFKEKFGLIANTGYNVDSFGHNVMLPQLLSKSGMDNYIFMRPGSHEKEVPNPMFYWHSPDGSKVLTYRIHYNSYGISHDVDEKIYFLAGDEDVKGDKAMLFYGVGNHGGGPTIDALNKIDGVIEKEGADNVCYSHPDVFFDEVRKSGCEIPNVKEDLQHHASGCYGTDFEFMKDHRMAEQMLMSAEKWNTAANLMTNIPINNDGIQTAWQKVMFNQFHDIMGGCSIQSALKDAAEAMGAAKHEAAEIQNSALQSISWAIDTHREGAKRSKEKAWMIWEQGDVGVPLVVFNPLSFPVKAPIELNMHVESIETADGEKVLTQDIRAQFLMKGKLMVTAFMAEVPAFGYRTYWLYKTKQADTSPQKLLKAEQLTMENQWHKAAFDDEGCISIYDKKAGCSIIKAKGAKALVIDEEHCDTWSHDVETFDKIIGSFDDADVKIVENGPVRTVIRVDTKYNTSKLRQDFILYAELPGVYVKVRLDWREPHCILKLDFPVNAVDPSVTYHIPYGIIEKKCDGREEPGLTWFDVTGNGNNDKQGLSIANDARYSYSADEKSMRLHVVRSPIFADHALPDVRHDECEYMDIGIHKLNYLLLPHAGDLRQSDIIKRAAMLNNPLPAVHETYHKGTLPQDYKGVEISADNVIMTVFKQREDGSSSHVIRLYETKGLNIDTSIKIPLINVDANIKFTPFEIKTLFVSEDGILTETSMIEGIEK